jgi:hypothetical protein
MTNQQLAFVEAACGALVVFELDKLVQRGRPSIRSRTTVLHHKWNSGLRYFA